MKAAVIDQDDQYRLVEQDTPRPGPGEVAIGVAYAGIQWGDVLVRDGQFPVSRPFVPGFEVAGHIVGLGAGVADRQVGEPVLALLSGGGYAEVAVAPAALTLPVGQLPLRTAAGLGWAGPTAYDLVTTVAGVRPGDRVLVHAAAGSVGTLAAQFAATAGAAELTGVVGSAERAAYARRFGYHEVLTREQFPDRLEGPFDVILDPVGGATRIANQGLLAPHGRLAAYGGIAGAEPTEHRAEDLLAQGQSLVTYNSSLLSRTHPDRLADSTKRALAEVASGAVRVDITAEYDLADLATAVRRLSQGATLGKSVIRVA
jgi:NADPH2:quinone reductase